MVILQFTGDYRAYLRVVLEKRQLKNPKYSLRALARDLGITGSHLSAVYLGKRNFSQATAFQVAQRLRFTERETEYFCMLVQHETTKLPQLKAVLTQRLASIKAEHNLCHTPVTKAP